MPGQLENWPVWVPTCSPCPIRTFPSCVDSWHIVQRCVYAFKYLYTPPLNSLAKSLKKLRRVCALPESDNNTGLRQCVRSFFFIIAYLPSWAGFPSRRWKLEVSIRWLTNRSLSAADLRWVKIVKETKILLFLSPWRTLRRHSMCIYLVCSMCHCFSNRFFKGAT